MQVKNAEDVRAFICASMEANLRTSIANMRAANLSERHIERFVADQMVQIETECDRVAADFERLKDNPDVASVAVN